MAYGKYRHSTILGEKGTTWEVEVWKKDYVNELDNSYFTTDLTDWTYTGGSGWFWASNGGIGGASSNSISILYQDNVFTVGQQYNIKISVTGRTTGSLLLKIGNTSVPLIEDNGDFSVTAICTDIQRFSIMSGSGWDGIISSVTASIDTNWVDSTEMNLSGEGFEVKWTGEGGTRNKQFIASECVLNMFVENQDDEDWLYNDVFQKGDNYHYIRIYKNSVSDANLWWYGWIQPGFDVIENAPFPYEFKLTATDSYGYFGKKKPSEFTSQEEKVEAYKIKDLLISDFGVDMNLISTNSGDLTPNPHNRESFRTSVDWWRPETTYQSSDPLAIHYAARGAFVENQDEDEEGISEGNPLEYKPIDVVNGVLKTFNTVGFLAEGFYNFIQPNSLAGNNTGEIRAYDYASTIVSPTPYDLDTLLTIDQSNNVVLGGSTITYEPSLEGVRLTYKQGVNSFNVASGQDLTSPIVVGMIQDIDGGTMTLDFAARHIESVYVSAFAGLNPTWSPYYHILENSYINIASLVISITDGSTTKYLTSTPTGALVWDSSPQTIAIHRGLGVNSTIGYVGVNSTSGTAVGNVSNGENLSSSSSASSYPETGTVGGPCYGTYYSTSQKYRFVTDIRFLAQIENPGISGDISIELDCSNFYYKANTTTTYPGPTYTINLGGYTGIPSSIDSSSTECVNITLTPTGSDSWSEQGESMIYSSEQTENTSYESFDLGDYNLGQTGVGAEYAVQYLNSGITTPVTTGFQRGNPTPDNPRNILQLVTKEFLELQVEPLEILQASIFSSDISPLKTIKYSINDDSNYKYYQFLGGSFKAQSETMDGEWYSINSKIDYITEPDPTPEVPNELTPPPTPNGSVEGQIGLTALIAKTDLINKSVGITDSDIDFGTTYNKVELDANSKAKVYDNQKIILSYADGSNQLILTASGDNLTSSDQINVDNFTPTTNYPLGCVVSILPYDLTNVITGGGGGTPGGTTRQVQFNDGGAFGAESGFEYDKTTDILTSRYVDGQYLGDNIGTIYDLYIYLTPLDFNISSGYRNPPYTDDNGATLRPSSSGVNYYVSLQVPLGYKAVKVDLRSSSNDSFWVGSSAWNSSSISTLGGGTTNTELTLSPSFTGLAGKYMVIKFDPNNTTDEIFGCKITLERI